MTVKRNILVPMLAVAALASTSGCGSSSSSSSAKKKETALTVLRSLKGAGLPIGAYVNYTAATDENHLLGRPGQYIHKVNFRDTRLKKPATAFDIDGGGSIETFSSEGEAKTRYGYVHAISSGSPLFSEYEYRDGEVLLRLSHYLTPHQAAEYKRALTAS
jgi:hypothetical protein